MSSDSNAAISVLISDAVRHILTNTDIDEREVIDWVMYWRDKDSCPTKTLMTNDNVIERLKVTMKYDSMPSSMKKFFDKGILEHEPFKPSAKLFERLRDVMYHSVWMMQELNSMNIRHAYDHYRILLRIYTDGTPCLMGAEALIMFFLGYLHEHKHDRDRVRYREDMRSVTFYLYVLIELAFLRIDFFAITVSYVTPLFSTNIFLQLLNVEIVDRAVEKIDVDENHQMFAAMLYCGWFCTCSSVFLFIWMECRYEFIKTMTRLPATVQLLATSHAPLSVTYPEHLYPMDSFGKHKNTEELKQKRLFGCMYKKLYRRVLFRRAFYENPASIAVILHMMNIVQSLGDHL